MESGWNIYDPYTRQNTIWSLILSSYIPTASYIKSSQDYLDKRDWDYNKRLKGLHTPISIICQESTLGILANTMYEGTIGKNLEGKKISSTVLLDLWHDMFLRHCA